MYVTTLSKTESVSLSTLLLSALALHSNYFPHVCSTATALSTLCTYTPLKLLPSDSFTCNPCCSLLTELDVTSFLKKEKGSTDCLLVFFFLWNNKTIHRTMSSRAKWIALTQNSKNGEEGHVCIQLLTFWGTRPAARAEICT